PGAEDLRAAAQQRPAGDDAHQVRGVVLLRPHPVHRVDVAVLDGPVELRVGLRDALHDLLAGPHWPLRGVEEGAVPPLAREPTGSPRPAFSAAPPSCQAAATRTASALGRTSCTRTAQ